MFLCLRRIQKLFRVGAPNLDIFSRVFFSGRIILKHIDNKKDSRGMIPRKIFENFDTVVTFLVLLKQFSGNFCLNSVPLILSVSPNVMVFVLKFSIMRTWGVRIEKI